MPNKKSAIHWLRIAYHDLESAKILFKANHYTDSIGNDLQQSLEKILKSFLAYNNSKIKKSHDLVEIYESIDTGLNLTDNELTYLEIATDYFKEDRYPNPYYSLPPKEEIHEVLEFCEKLLTSTCQLLNIDLEVLKEE